MGKTITRIVAVSSTGKGKHKLAYFTPIAEAKLFAKACANHWRETDSLSCKDMLRIMRQLGLPAPYPTMLSLRKWMIESNQLILTHKQPRSGVRGGKIIAVNVPE